MSEGEAIEGEAGAREATEGRSCAWCATPAADADTQCRSCGAALAQRESIGDLRVPGLTSLDPALEDYASRPMHLRGPSPSHGVASGAIAAAALGGPAGLAIIGGVAAVAAVEYLGASSGGGGRTNLADVGRPSEVVLQALERADAGGAHASDASTDDGRSIWRDLPPSAPAEPPSPAEDPAPSQS